MAGGRGNPEWESPVGPFFAGLGTDGVDSDEDADPEEPAEPLLSASAEGMARVAAPTPSATASAPTRPTLSAKPASGAGRTTAPRVLNATLKAPHRRVELNNSAEFATKLRFSGVFSGKRADVSAPARPAAAGGWAARYAVSVSGRSTQLIRSRSFLPVTSIGCSALRLRSASSSLLPPSMLATSRLTKVPS